MAAFMSYLRCTFHFLTVSISALYLVCRLIPEILACGKAANALTTQMISATFHELIDCIAAAPQPTFVEALYRCLTKSLELIGGPVALPKEYHDAVMEVTNRQIQGVQQRRKERAHHRGLNPMFAEQLAFLEEIDDTLLESVAALLQCFDPNHPLLASM